LPTFQTGQRIEAAGANPAAFYLSRRIETQTRNVENIMLHPYKHQLLHKSDQRERIQEVEHDRLLQLVSLHSSQSPTALTLYMLIGKWLTNRLSVLKENRTVNSKIVMPEA